MKLWFLVSFAPKQKKDYIRNDLSVSENVAETSHIRIQSCTQKNT